MDTTTATTAIIGSWHGRWLAPSVAWLIVGFARVLTGVRAAWPAGSLQAGPTVYFANHSSHADFVLVWATLPPDLRRRTRPVAGLDYWDTSALRRFIGRQVFHALLIRRDGSQPGGGAVEQMAGALDGGDALILFPEGTRNTGDDVLLPLRSGLFHLARRCPDARLIPVWIENLQRVLPKGAIIPLPLACTVRYGAPLPPRQTESKDDFIARARAALLALRPRYDEEPEPHRREHGNPPGRPCHHDPEDLCNT